MKKVFVHFADGFEEIEALAPVDILRRAGCEVTMVSVMGRKEVTSSRGVKVIADKLFEEVNYSGADMLVLPGGMPGSKHLDEHAGLKEKLKEANQQGKLIGAICAAPMVLGHLGLLKGKRATCYPGNESALEGAILSSKGVEKDGTIITAKGAGVSVKFGLTLVEVLVGAEKANEVKEKMMVE
ncbi:MAG TPA: DJ-1 family glyoxalase III [Bacteroidales bacterium]|nr:DJ-1 family glyoxalase III [Bacteroidales bacterium]